MKKENRMNITKDLHHKRNKIIVNLITGIRALGSIIIIPIFISFGYLGVGISSIIFLLTDCIDGKLARKLHVQSFFGALLDGISDKIYSIVCLILLSLNNPLFFLTVLSEILILTINYLRIKKGNNVKSSYLGKVKNCILGVAIVGSFFCLVTPDLKEVFHLINGEFLYKFCMTKSKIITSFLAISIFLSSLATATDYLIKVLKTEKKGKKLNNDRKEKLRLKNKQEIAQDIISTEFYLEHKDDSILDLLYTKKE